MPTQTPFRQMHPMPDTTQSRVTAWRNGTHEIRTSDGTRFRATKVGKSERYDPPRRAPGKPEWRNITMRFDGWTITQDFHVEVRSDDVRRQLLEHDLPVDAGRRPGKPSLNDAKRLARFLAERHEATLIE